MLKNYRWPAGAIQHARYAGRVRRLNADGQPVAEVKVPAERMLTSTTLVISADFSRVLVLHQADDFNFRAKLWALTPPRTCSRARASMRLERCWLTQSRSSCPGCRARLLECFYQRLPSLRR